MPEGTYADPWWVELTGFWQCRPLAWTSEDGSVLGFGLERVMLSETSEELGVEFEVVARLDIAEIEVGSGAKLQDESAFQLPRFTLTATAKNPVPDTPLIDYQGLIVGSVEFGAYTDVSGITPVVTLYDSRVDAEVSCKPTTSRWHSTVRNRSRSSRRCCTP